MKKFESEHEANNWVSTNYKNEIEKLNDVKNPKYKPMHFYTSDMFVPWNKILQMCKCTELEDLSKYIGYSENSYFIKEDFVSITKIRKLLRETKICDDIVVYRFMKKKDFKELLKNRINKNTYIDYGFLSTTLLPFSSGMIDLKNERSYQILLQLNVSKGIAGMPIKYNREHSVLEEYEVVLDFGLKFILRRKYFDWKHFIRVYEFDLVS